MNINLSHELEHSTKWREDKEYSISKSKYFLSIKHTKATQLIIIYFIFYLFFKSRRQHLNNWSMTKENRDPIAALASDVPTKASTMLSTHKNAALEKSQKLQNSPKTSSVNNATDLFELLERCQSQRLDDQRCVLPSYFSQVSWFSSNSSIPNPNPTDF